MLFITPEDSFIIVDIPFVCTFCKCEKDVLSTSFSLLCPKVDIFREVGTHEELRKFRNRVIKNGGNLDVVWAVVCLSFVDYAIIDNDFFKS